MALTPKIEIKQSQSLLMTPQLRQAINLLQMNNLELNDLIAEELNANPLLDREDDRLSQIQDTTVPSINDPEETLPPSEEVPSNDIDYDNNFEDDFGSDRAGYDDIPTDADWKDYHQQKIARTDEDFDYFEQRLSTQKSLYSFLDEQISLKFNTPKEKLIASRLTTFLDAAGYFRGNLTEISTKLNIQASYLQTILKQLQTFEPSGIFATSLQECLKIQLQDKDRYDPYMAFLLDNLDLVAEKKYKELKRIGNFSDEDLADMLSDLKSLNPKPASSFDYDLTSYVIPDVYVSANKYGEYIIELNSKSLPRVLINQEYYSEIKNLSTKNKEAKRYLKDKLSSANFLIKALHQRATTILRVSEEIVKFQRDFFEKGVDYLKPMLLRDIAEELEMHESTISRVTTHKYMHTPRGIFELKYFFSSAAGSYSGDENTSVTAIKHKIKQLIDAETPDKILSDDMIVELLARQGIKIARRTVAKYREGMNISSSAQRKRAKRPNS